MPLASGLVLLVLLIGSDAAAAETDGGLSRFSARYDLSRNGISVGDTKVSLELGDDGGYTYSARTEPSGVLSLWREDLIREESRGRLVDGRPRPDHYLYHREGDGINLHLELHFDWEDAKVHIESGGTRWSLDIDHATLDKLVQQLVFVQDLANGAQHAGYRVADGGRLKDYSYRVLGQETIEVPHGRHQVIKAERSKGHGPPEYTLWLAPGLDHRPVRILRRHRGARYQMDLEELDRQSPP